MSNVNLLLSKRMKKSEKSSKMSEVGRQSAAGNLTSFSGVFSIVDLNDGEKDLLEAILNEYSIKTERIGQDLTSLISITSEVKAINNQAAILHGERLKGAQEILKHYRDGAFTTWLVAAYGNRQTPYNFLQYYEFYTAMPKMLRPLIEAMPRQAVYTLASREGSLEKKKQIVESYGGETKTEVLQKIREAFPLSLEDKRRENVGESVIRGLQRLLAHLRDRRGRISKPQKREIANLLEELSSYIDV